MRSVPTLSSHLVVRALTGLALLAAAAGAPAAAQQVIYTERITGGDLPARVEHLWALGPTMRAATVVGGHPIVTLVIGDRYVMYDAAVGSGISIARHPGSIAGDETRGRPFGNELDFILEMGAEKVGEEKLAGRSCDLYRVSHDRGKIEVCAAQDELRLPLVRRNWLKATGNRAETRYLEWVRNMAAAPNFFEPDPRITIEAMTYEEFRTRSAGGQAVGPAPVLYPELLHAKR
jgi:hypothetical protein